MRDTPTGMIAEAKGQRIQTVPQLLAATEVDLKIWEPHRGKVNTWETTMRLGWGDTARVHQVTNYQVTVHLQRRASADIKPPPLPRRPTPIRKRRKPAKHPAALVLPDTQHGFRWAKNYQALEPLHDVYAIDCAIQAAEQMQPEVVVLLGDMLDAAAFGRYRTAPDLKQTTTPSLWALHYDLLRLRKACPDSRIVITPGNHDERINKAITDHLPEAVNLKGVGEPDALSLPRMLRLEEMGIEWIGEYGDSFWLWDQVEITHGQKHGRQVHDQVKHLSHTLIQGHAHLHAIASKRIVGPSSSRLIHAISPGCLCRVDGAVPATTKRVDWHQGFVGLHLVGDTVHANLTTIIDGTAWLGGRGITGQDRSAELAHWMAKQDQNGGWPQVAYHGFRRAA